MCIYIYTRFCSQLILELLSVESIRARQLCTNDSITGRDESLEISRPEIRALCISLSLSLYLYASTNRAFISAVPFLFFSFSFFFPSFIYHCRPRLFVSLSLPLFLPFFAPSTFIYPSNFFRSALALTHRKGGWRLVGGNWEGRSRKTWMDEKRRGEGRW